MLAVKTVLITGGARGIGREIALALARSGAQVAVAARSKKDIEETAEHLRAHGGRFLAQSCDVSQPDQVEALFSAIENKLGPVDGLVCAAAIHGPIGPFISNDLSEWKSVLDINVMGTAICVQRAARSMQKNRHGRMVLFSGGGEKAFQGFSAYVASKGAIWTLS